MLSVDIQKQLGNFRLNVQFETTDGVLALLGASGCGKSMTLKCIAGIERPDAGKIVLNGRVLFDSKRRIDLSPQQRRVGYLFQSLALFPQMTVRQNIGAGVHHKDTALRERIVEEKIHQYYLDGQEQKYPSQLSGGQQQRVALARMLAGEPEAVLLDEPFSGLDSYLKWQLEQELHVAMQPFDGSAVFVSHNRDEVLRLCAAVCLVENGASQGVTDPRTLMEQPRTLAAALLAGFKNFSRIHRRNEHQVFAIDWGAELNCARPVPEDANYICIHAHKLRIGSHEGQNTLHCRIMRMAEDTHRSILSLEPLTGAGGDYGRIRLELPKENAAGLNGGGELYLRLNEADILPLK